MAISGAFDQAEALSLWNWFCGLDMQEAMHIGNDEATKCWTGLKEMSKEELFRDSEKLNLLASMRIQYQSFTGRSRRPSCR